MTHDSPSTSTPDTGHYEISAPIHVVCTFSAKSPISPRPVWYGIIGLMAFGIQIAHKHRLLESCRSECQSANRRKFLIRGVVRLWRSEASLSDLTTHCHLTTGCQRSSANFTDRMENLRYRSCIVMHKTKRLPLPTEFLPLNGHIIRLTVIPISPPTCLALFCVKQQCRLCSQRRRMCCISRYR